MKALIHDTRICQIVDDDSTFPVHEGLQWVDVADDTVVDRDTYVDNKVVKYIARVPDWKENRVNNYPNMGDQLDDLYKKGAFSDEMAAQIKAVKDKYPKGD